VTRRIVLSITAAAVLGSVLPAAAVAVNPIRLYLEQGAAFAVLGHSCGGIQEKVYVRGFASSGYPEGNAELETRCGGSGRGGGGGTTTYKGTASVVWTWFGETRSYGTPGTPLEAIGATDSHGDRVYNSGTAAYLETGTPPLKPPAAPTGVHAEVLLNDETNHLQMTVYWTVDPQTARLIKSSTATAAPVGSSAPVLSRTVTPYFSDTVLAPVEPGTTYSVTVTSADSEGTSAASVPIEIKSPNSDGEAEKETKKTETCTANSGKIKLKPGLSEKPAVQKIALAGNLSGCAGPLGFESASYTAKLLTTEAVTCLALSSGAQEGTSSTSLSVTWLPAGNGRSTGALILPLAELPLSGMTGTLSGGPFAAATSFKAGSVFESFTGGSTCGQQLGRHKAKPVKSGSFSTGEVEFG
jgi:hypothetical protein